LFPQFQQNPFFIAGESYAGVYVPTLAQQVVIGNQNNVQPHINLQGILVGNGVTDQVFDGNAFPSFAAGHALISQTLYSNLQTSCSNEYWNATGNCAQFLGTAGQLVQDLNIYNIYIDCYQGNNAPYEMDPFERVKQRVSDSIVEVPEGEVPCIDSSVATAWLNQDSVRTALHAVSVATQQWTICSNLINYQTVYSTVIPVHQFLLNSGIRILIYSGDTDMCVPFTGSEAWTTSLGIPIVSDWRPWYVNSQVAGYVKDYGTIRFATIKGAGHMVPQYRPPQALYFFTQFLADQPF